MAEITTNSYELTQLARARADVLGPLIGSLDAKRPDAWRQYGYKVDLRFPDYRQAYERGGPAHGAIEGLLEACWEELPRIKSPTSDKTSKWEKDIAEAMDDIDGWQKLMALDQKNMVGRFAAVIYRVADGRPLSEPLGRGTELVDLIPLYEDQIKPTAWYFDQKDTENYGKPAMFQYWTWSPSGSADTDAKPESWVDVHPSRVQILAEGAPGGDFYEGVPMLRAGYNALVDMEKTRGGGAESALKNSARTIKFEYDANASPQAITSNPDGTPGTKTVREVHEEQTQKLNKNQDSAIVIQGGKADTLQTSVSDLSPQWQVAANEFAASVRMPFTVVFGQQTGRLASDEDQKQMNKRAKARQRRTLTPMLTQFVKRMQACGVFKPGKFKIEWPPLGAETDTQKLSKAKTMAETNQIAFNGGATEPIFDSDEIRKAADYEERGAGKGDELKEETPPTEPTADPLAKPGTKPATPPKADPAAK